MSSMYDMYKICHIYKRIFAWIQILYIICGNNILEIHYNTESYTPLHNVSYNTESYTPLHNVPDISSLIKGTGDSNRLSCPIHLIISAWISTNVHTHIDEYVIIDNTKS
jgi:hypothetical protein